MKAAIAVGLEFVREEELTPLVELERAGFFFFVDNVWRSSSGDAHGPCWKLMHFASVLEFAVFGVVTQSLENDGLDRVVLIGNGLVRIHAFDKIDPFLKGLLYFFMIETVS